MVSSSRKHVKYNMEEFILNLNYRQLKIEKKEPKNLYSKIFTNSKFPIQ